MTEQSTREHMNIRHVSDHSNAPWRWQDDLIARTHIGQHIAKKFKILRPPLHVGEVGCRGSILHSTPPPGDPPQNRSDWVMKGMADQDDPSAATLSKSARDSMESDESSRGPPQTGIRYNTLYLLTTCEPVSHPPHPMTPSTQRSLHSPRRTHRIPDDEHEHAHILYRHSRLAGKCSQLWWLVRTNSRARELGAPARWPLVRTKRPAPPPERPSKRPCIKPNDSTPDEPPSSPLRPLDKIATPKPFDTFKPEPFAHVVEEIGSDCWALFEQWIPRWLVEKWVAWTNEKRGAMAVPAARQASWIPTFTEEIYLLIPRHPFTRLISRDRFLLLMRNICLYDSSDTTARVWDKVDDWNQHMQSIPMCLWCPGSQISIDEAMVPFSGRSKEIVRLPSKPIPIGFKVWVMAQQGYFLQWAWHEKGGGPVGLTPQIFSGKALANTQAVVAWLLSKLPPAPSPSRGYHVFIDNLFATAPLLKLLRERGIAATGTTRARTGGIGDKFISLKKEDDKRDCIPWGTAYSRPTKDQKVMQFAWKDNILRLRHCPSKTSSSAKTARFPFDGEFAKELPIPQFIDDYNHFMGGVDIGDQLKSSYNWDRRTRRGGWRAIAFLFLLEVCITNSWQLWRRQEGNKESHLDVRRNLYRDSKIRRPKRGWCAFCSSNKKKAILTVEYPHGQNQRKSNIFFGCTVGAF
ncbi:transposase IS4 domain-containing protein [Pochonia chlamydosporia 170]|uniref:Transposase IS4 domain-containing protein n=1 Tax=Pochonia chlamydosporia 170 TaxID=1380566 RepID=A0A179EYW6_METCM|nr:transposase IS4 domain-containing protein [Pochonia chlamydosporia 170]OAQ58397.2 transposase IS4 domain-containing protein [Pochonia chlamydosporia 170]